MTSIQPSLGRVTGDPGDDGTQLSERLNAPQGGTRPGPANFGVDYDGPPVTDSSNHIAAVMSTELGQPSVATQMVTHGKAAPRTPDLTVPGSMSDRID